MKTYDGDGYYFITLPVCTPAACSFPGENARSWEALGEANHSPVYSPRPSLVHRVGQALLVVLGPGRNWLVRRESQNLASR